jgi:predicted ATPase
MIKSIYIDNYRSVRKLSIDLGRLNVVFGPNGCGKSNIYKAIHLIHGAAMGQLSHWLSDEGGIQKVMWAGSRAKGYASAPRRMTLAVDTDDFEYELQVGFPDKLPYPTMFDLDPIVKEEQIWLSGFRRRPSSSIMHRRNQAVFLNDVNGEKVTHAATL